MISEYPGNCTHASTNPQIRAVTSRGAPLALRTLQRTMRLHGMRLIFSGFSLPAEDPNVAAVEGTRPLAG